jgi:hypothetical protein
MKYTHTLYQHSSSMRWKRLVVNVFPRILIFRTTCILCELNLSKELQLLFFTPNSKPRHPQKTAILQSPRKITKRRLLVSRHQATKMPTTVIV